MTKSPPAAAIFGATSDIAAAVARRYAEAGWRLALIGRNSDILEAAAADLRIRGAADVHVHLADFADSASLPKASAAAWCGFGGLDLALIAYGTLPDQSTAEQDRAACEAALMLNFTSPILLANELGRRFAAQRSGTLAVISSVAGDRGRGSNFIYGAAKGGLQRYLEGLRHRLIKQGVTVLDIRPGFVMTSMTSNLPQGGLLWAKPDRVAADITKAISGHNSVLYTPWFWKYIMAAVRGLPRALFHKTNL